MTALSAADLNLAIAQEARVDGGGERAAHEGKLRGRLFELLQSYRPHAPPRTAGCARVRHDYSVQVHVNEGRAGLAGLIKCRSKCCPVCMSARKSQNADRVARVVRNWSDNGGHVYLATFTIRHGRGDDLQHTGRELRNAWRAFCGGRFWKDYRHELGLEYITAEEVTHGKNGWHPHLHILVLSPQELPDVEATADAWYERWKRCVSRHIGEKHAPAPDIGTDLRACHSSEYISKLGLEISDPGNKTSKGGRTPLQLLADWCDHEDRHALELYKTHTEAMRGQKDLTWSRGLIEARDLADDELAEEAPTPELVATIPGDVWDRFRDLPHAHESLLSAAELGGADEVRKLFATKLDVFLARPPPKPG